MSLDEAVKRWREVPESLRRGLLEGLKADMLQFGAHKMHDQVECASAAASLLEAAGEEVA